MKTMEVGDQIRKLAALAERDPRKVADALTAFWAMHPALLEDLICDGPVKEVGPVRRRHDGVAVVGNEAIPVWEIARLFRRTLDLGRLRQEFPMLSEIDLLAAMQHSCDERAEINALIEEYERNRASKLSE